MDFNQAIIVLSAGVKKDTEGNWQNTDLDANDNNLGAPGGNMRVIAASILHKQNPDQYIIASGGRGRDIKNDEPSRPDLSKVIKNKLIELDIAEEYIIEENRSNTTYEQFVELKSIINKYNLNNLIIITNRWHLPRTQAIIKEVDDLKEFYKSISYELIAAEDILLKNNLNEWQGKIENAYQSDWLKKRIKCEEVGIKQIKKGKYKF